MLPLSEAAFKARTGGTLSKKANYTDGRRRRKFSKGIFETGSNIILLPQIKAAVN